MITMQPRPTVYQSRSRSRWFTATPPPASPPSRPDRENRHLRAVPDERPDGIVMYHGRVFKRVDIDARMRGNERTDSRFGHLLRVA